MTTAIYIPDKNANGKDYLSSNGVWGLIGNTDIISAVDFPKGRHIYCSENLNVYSCWNRIYIKTFLSNESRDVKNRLVPVSFMTKVLNPVHALDKFVKKLEEYGDNVESSVLDELKKALKRERRRRTVFMVVATLTFLAICLIYK
jgi:hypothetical protein